MNDNRCPFCFPWLPWNLLLFAVREVKLIFKWLKNWHLPHRPEDWETRGVNGTDRSASVDYANWFNSSPRILAQMLGEFPILVVGLVALVAVITGWLGTANLGSPLLFFPDESAWVSREKNLDPDAVRWFALLTLTVTGSAAGFVLFSMCFVGLLLSSREWMRWAAPLSEEEEADNKQFARINHYLRSSWGILISALILCVAFGGPGRMDDWFAWLEKAIFSVSVYSAGVVSWWLLLKLLAWHRHEDCWFALVRNWMTRRVMKFKRLSEGTDLHDDAESAHVLAFGGAGILLLCWLVVFIEPNLLAFVNTAVFVCLFLGMVVAMIAYFQFHGISYPVVLPVVVVALLMVAGKYLLGPQPLREFDSIQYDKRYTLQEIEQNIEKSEQAPEGLDPEDVLSKWYKENEEKPVLVLISTSGGGIRASSWTVHVLCRLEEAIPTFHRYVRIITGASGGMLGAAYYVAELEDCAQKNEDITKRCETMYSNITRDSLQDTARWLVLRDVPQSILRTSIGHIRPLNKDRGQAIEQTWRDNTQQRLGRTFGEIRTLESEGKLPSLIFSPMVVEDGRRLLLSNLDLNDLTRIDVFKDEESLADTVTAWEFHRCFPGQLKNVKLSAAARMNATFPFITPAGELPTQPPLRVVDAGYFDNYGVNLMSEFLWHHSHPHPKKKRMLAENNSGVKDVILIQIRSNLETHFRSEREGAFRETHGLRFPDLTTPLEGLLSANSSVSAFTNDAHLLALREHLAARGVKFHLITFDLPGGASLSWHLSAAEKKIIRQGFPKSDEMDLKEVSEEDRSASSEALKNNATQLKLLKKLMGN